MACHNVLGLLSLDSVEAPTVTVAVLTCNWSELPKLALLACHGLHDENEQKNPPSLALKCLWPASYEGVGVEVDLRCTLLNVYVLFFMFSGMLAFFSA